MKKINLLAIVKSRVARMAVAFLTAGAALSVTSAHADEKIKVRIGYQSLWAVGGEVVEVLRHTNIFELNGIEAEYKAFTSGGPLAEAAVAGDIDNIFASDAPSLRAMARMPGSKILQRTHDSRFGILVQPDFQGSLADLKGKKLSAPFATTTFPRSMKVLVAAGISDPFQEMTIINQDVGEQVGAMQGHLVDAIMTWDPTMERMLQQKMAKVLWSAPQGESIGIQGFSGEWLQKYGNDGAVKFLKAWIIATWWASNHIDQAHEWFAERSRLPVDILTVSSDFDRNLGAPILDINNINLNITDDRIAGTQDVMDFLYDRNLLTTKVEAKDYYDMGPLSQAASEIRAGNRPDLSAITIIGQ